MQPISSEEVGQNLEVSKVEGNSNMFKHEDVNPSMNLLQSTNFKS